MAAAHRAQCIRPGELDPGVLHHEGNRVGALYEYRVGAGATLRDCYVGPYTAVGEGCAIENAEVEHSILLAGSVVHDLDGRMESSLLGRNVKIGRDDRQPRAYRFLVGDNSELSIP